ncbi:MAG TPA: P-loop NTPase fold protein [Candidatus Methanoperedens sp.]
MKGRDTMELLTDNPITKVTEDRFGFKLYSDVLANAILETNRLPFCVGIFGAWGTGKSSLMLMIKELVEKNDYIKTIWFNPWKYDKKEELWNALIQTILYRIAEDDDRDKVKNKAKELAKSTSWLLLKKGLSTLTAGIISEENVENIKDVIVKEDEIHYRHVNHFEKDFEEIVNLYTKNGKLIVFIDDLDRCLPENAITVLESLKLFIGDAKCVFVIGMDHYIVEEGIKFRFGEKVKMSGRDYLDKIIQVPFFLPPVPFNKLRDALRVAKTTDYSEEIWKLIEFGLDTNPRKTKRFVNCFYLLREIIKGGAYTYIDDDNREYGLDPMLQDFFLAKLLIFQMSFSNFYSHLKLYPDDWEIYQRQLLYQGLKPSILQQRPDLEEFWNDEQLRRFMDKTSGLSNPPDPPSAKIVSELLKTIILVSPSYGMDATKA